MGKENDVMVEFLRDKRRFADLFNGGLFAGEQVVKAEDLERDSENYTEFRLTGSEEKSDAKAGMEEFLSKHEKYQYTSVTHPS